MNYQRLQHGFVVIWLLLVCVCLGVTFRQLITQYAGTRVTATVISKSTWNPPFAGWPRYNCTLSDSRHAYTVPSTILSWCVTGTKQNLVVDPLSPNRAQFDGDILDNGTVPAWYFLGLSAVFVGFGLALKLAGKKDPWRSALTGILDRIQGVRSDPEP